MTISHREFHEVANRKRSGFSDRLPKGKPKTPERHARKCVICRHPQRDEIEAAFLHWDDVVGIASKHNIRNHRGIYRHAHATGLYALRRLKFLCAAERAVERAYNVSNDPDALLRAVYTCSHLNNLGERRPAPRRIVVFAAAAQPALDSTQSPNPARPTNQQDVTSQSCPSTRESALPGLPEKSLEIEPGLNLIVSNRGIRLNSNRQFSVRLKTHGNA
jgi:hypothetical protein